MKKLIWKLKWFYCFHEWDLRFKQLKGINVNISFNNESSKYQIKYSIAIAIIFKIHAQIYYINSTCMYLILFWFLYHRGLKLNPKMTLTITEYIPDQHDHNLTSTPTKSSSSNHTVELSSPSTNNNSSTDIMSNNNSVSYQHQVTTTPMINNDTTGFSMDYSHNNNNSCFSPYKVM